MSKLTKLLDRWLYADFNDQWDNSLFRQAIDGELTADARVLDLGAGAGIVEQTRFRGQVAHVCGVDPDPRVNENPYLDEAHEGVGEAIPCDDASFDLVFANNVLEHLEEPVSVFREVARVLKPGGCFLTKTPNRWHYMPLIASCTPHWFHQFANHLRGRDAEDTFPTHYRANSRRDIHRIGQSAGLEVDNIAFIEGRPEYLRMTTPTYLAGWCYERAVNVIPSFDRFRVVMISVLRKPADNSLVESKSSRRAA